MCSFGALEDIEVFGEAKHGSNCINNGAKLIVRDTGCGLTSMGETNKLKLRSYYNTNCKGLSGCQLDIAAIEMTGVCLTPLLSFIRAGCSSEDVLNISKTSIGLIIAIFDVIIVLFVWTMLILHKKFEDKEENEVEEDTLTGSDFTIEIKLKPKPR
jgi:hypothetical protein